MSSNVLTLLLVSLILASISADTFPSSLHAHVEPLLNLRVDHADKRLRGTQTVDTLPKRTLKGYHQPLPNHVNLKFSAYGKEFDFDMTLYHHHYPNLNENREIPHAHRINQETMEIEEIETHLTTYKTKMNEKEWATVSFIPHSPFTGIYDQMFVGEIVTETELYSIKPVYLHRDHMDDHNYGLLTDSATHGLVVTRASDDIADKTCGTSKAHNVNRQAPLDPTQAETDLNDHEIETQAQFTPGFSRKLLALSQWSDCYTGDSTMKQIEMGFHADYKMETDLGSEATVNAVISNIVASTNNIYEAQMNLRIVIATTRFYNGAGSSCTSSSGTSATCTGMIQSSCSLGIATVLNQLGYWYNLGNQGTTADLYPNWHHMTTCYTSGTVGIAWKGTVGRARWTSSNQPEAGSTGVSNTNSWLTYAHEVGHNFGADHTWFYWDGSDWEHPLITDSTTSCTTSDNCGSSSSCTMCQGDVGGIMDYADGRLPVGTGEIQFHSTYSKPQMCDEVEYAMSRGSTSYPPYYDNTFTNAAPAVCGDGTVEGDEICEPSVDGSCCASDCTLASGASCAPSWSINGVCCDSSTCSPEIPSTSCSLGASDGSCQNGYCVGTSFCDQYSNTDQCTPTNANPCVNRCLYTNDGNCYATSAFGATTASDLYVPDGVICDSNGGTCESGACTAVAASYSWNTGQWGSCQIDGITVTCGTAATQSRSVTCVEGGSTTVADSFCDAGTKPDTSQSCGYGACVTYSWQVGNWGTCTNFCQDQGTQTRTVNCESSSGTVVADGNCDAGSEPPSSQTCGSTACNPSWEYGQFSSCSVTCGTGTQTRTATCQILSGTTAGVYRTCTANEETQAGTPTTSQSCDSGQTCPSNLQERWVEGDFGTCSKECRESVNDSAGTQTRTVTCQTSPDGITWTSQSDSACATTKPGTSQTCNTEICYWDQGAFGSCSVTCGGGSQSRNVFCAVVRGTTEYVVDNSHCAANTEPASTVSCNSDPCPVYSAVPGAWSACSAECPTTTGTQTRTWTCVDTAQNPDEIVTQATCTNNEVVAPSTSQSCEIFCETYSWTEGNWGSCSASCGSGTRSRTVTCIIDGTSVTTTESNCDSVFKPTTSEACNTQACPSSGTSYYWDISDYGVCSVACGGGTRTRDVICRDSTGDEVTDATCTANGAGSKPATSEVCGTASCGYYWSYTDWGSCSVTTCGSIGFRQRDVDCRDAGTDAVVVDSNCAGTTPASTQDCSTDACPEWVVGAYEGCPTDGTCVASTTVTRDVYCFSYAADSQVSDSQCTGTKPSTSTNCDCSNIDDGCLSQSPCQNGGTCAASGICDCPIGYSGDDCSTPPQISNVEVSGVFSAGEIIDISWFASGDIPYVSILLNNQGLFAYPRVIAHKIVNSASDASYQTYQWEIPSYYESDDRYRMQVKFSSSVSAYSDTFEIEDPCYHLSCGTHGTCSNGECVCLDGYSGTFCTISPCGALNCGLESLCDESLGEQAICECTNSYTGDDCNTPPQCSDTNCNGYGDASLFSGTCGCSCIGYYGSGANNNCDTCGISTCENGGTPNADCTACDCPSGLSGDTCHCVFTTFTFYSPVGDGFIGSDADVSAFKDAVLLDINSYFSHSYTVTVSVASVGSAASGFVAVTLGIQYTCVDQLPKLHHSQRNLLSVSAFIHEHDFKVQNIDDQWTEVNNYIQDLDNEISDSNSQLASMGVVTSGATTSEPEDDSGNGFGPTQIGIAVGAAIFILAIGIGVGYLCMKRRSKHKQTEEQLRMQTSQIGLRDINSSSNFHNIIENENSSPSKYLWSNQSSANSAIQIDTTARKGPPPLPAMQAANSGLPPHWEAHNDGKGNIYYWNRVTDESTWTKPTR